MSTIAETFTYAAGELLQARDPNVDVLGKIVGLHREVSEHFPPLLFIYLRYPMLLD